MAELKLTWSLAAQKARAEIIRYWTRRNHSSAFGHKLNNDIRNRLKELKAHPFTGKRCKGEDPVYFVAVNEYLIFYLVEEHIEILSVWDRRRNPASAPYPIELNEP